MSYQAREHPEHLAYLRAQCEAHLAKAVQDRAHRSGCLRMALSYAKSASCQAGARTVDTFE